MYWDINIDMYLYITKLGEDEYYSNYTATTQTTIANHGYR